jgi:hypothetical protein
MIQHSKSAAVQLTPVRAIARASRRLNTRRLFVLINLLVFTVTVVAAFGNEYAEAGDVLYIIVLCLLCTFPILFVRSYRGKQSLMLIFLAYYFGVFGLQEISNLLSGEPVYRFDADSLLSGGEIAILLGAACFMTGYALVAVITPRDNAGILTREWSPKVTGILGILFWAVGFYITMMWQFGFGDRNVDVAVSQVFGGFLSLLRYLQPLGTLVLIYLALSSRKRSAYFLLILTLLADFVLGFLGDSKEIAFRGPLLYLFSLVVLRERLPVVQGVVFILVAGIAFNLFASYRLNLQLSQVSRGEAFRNIGENLGNIAGEGKSAGERLSEGLDYFIERISLKKYVEMIVERTGDDIAFQNGRTIEPLLYVFIPRFIYPDKPDSSMAGQLFNQEFRISGKSTTYIAMSQLGELYWNFGWTGMIVGMLSIGAVMASIATALRMDITQTLPRFLLLLMTIYMLSLRFETALAQNYVVWIRLSVLLLLLSAFVPKARKMTWQARA